MDGSTDSTAPGADVYTKRWEPSEERKPGRDIYDELARILLADEHRDSLEWSDGRPVFPPESRNTVPTGRAASRGMCTQQNEVQQ